MDNWSPNTSVRYGFSRVDSYGNVVSIWNFGDWSDALSDIGFGEESGREGECIEPLLVTEVDTLSNVNSGQVSEGLRGSDSPLSYTPVQLGVEYSGIRELCEAIRNARENDIPSKDMSTLEVAATNSGEFPKDLLLLEPYGIHGLDAVIHEQWGELDSGRVALLYAAVWCMVSEKGVHQLSETGRDLLVHILCHSLQESWKSNVE